MKIALLIQYDGTAYHGWQIQADPETIQGHIERALAKMFNTQLGLIGSGRTDSGVHAMGQVAHFEIDSSNIPVANICRALNRQLPDDIRIIASQTVDDRFHSRFAARQREYRYQIAQEPNVLSRNSRWHVRYPLDMDKLHEVSRSILGEHDFSSFCYAGTETENMICTIEEAIWQETLSGDLDFIVRADRFLHHMVRMLVGSMIEVARGKWSVEHFNTLLNQPNRQSHVVTAPAKGLSLVKVSYPEAIQPMWL